ncbi:MAG: glycosyltransferase family 4 protein [Alkalimonas sp.]|nr:glycosyltransferase family 4 protein [Alkalimonas sp.]
MHILLISNMGPKPSAPVQGQFIEQQRQALPVPTDYHFMRWHQDTLLNRCLKYPVWALSFFWRYLCRRKTYQLLHVHFYYPTIWLAILYKLLRNRKVAIVVTCHGSDIYHYQPPGWGYRWCARWVDHWVFASPALQQRFFKPVRSASVLSAGIAAEFAEVEPVALTDKDIDVLFVGSLDHNKGLDRLHKLLPHLSDRQVVVIGQGAMQHDVESWSSQYPNVRWLPTQSQAELIRWYRRSKVLLSLSRKESFGLVMTEALACSTPVIATETDGSVAQLQADYGVLIAQSEQEDDLTVKLLQAMQQLWQLPEAHYQHMQQQGRYYAQGQLLPVIAEQLIERYRRLQANKGTAA